MLWFQNLENLPIVWKAKSVLKGCSLAQLSLAWVMAQGKHIVPIPGTTRIENLEANVRATQVELTSNDLQTIMEVLNNFNVQGERYTQEGMKGVSV
jgi:aryl-alcohol dehydrogenase-like predicted oxidoreductase